MSSVVLSMSKRHHAPLKILISLVDKGLTRKYNHELLGNIPEVTEGGRQSFQLLSDTHCSMLRLACAGTEKQVFCFSTCGDTPWEDITEQRSHGSYSKQAPRKSFSTLFSHISLPLKTQFKY